MSTRIGWSRNPRDGRGHVHVAEVLSVDGSNGWQLIIGWHRFSRRELEELRDKGIRLRLRAFGIISFTADVSPKLFDDVFESIDIVGLVRNRPARRTADASDAA